MKTRQFRVTFHDAPFYWEEVFHAESKSDALAQAENYIGNNASAEIYCIEEDED